MFCSLISPFSDKKLKKVFETGKMGYIYNIPYIKNRIVFLCKGATL